MHVRAYAHMHACMHATDMCTHLHVPSALDAYAGLGSYLQRRCIFGQHPLCLSFGRAGDTQRQTGAWVHAPVSAPRAGACGKPRGIWVARYLGVEVREEHMCDGNVVRDVGNGSGAALKGRSQRGHLLTPVVRRRKVRRARREELLQRGQRGCLLLLPEEAQLVAGHDAQRGALSEDARPGRVRRLPGHVAVPQPILRRLLVDSLIIIISSK